MHTLLALLLLAIGACDFDIPEKFEMPTWYLDLKIPLVQTRYQMVDISDSTSGIFIEPFRETCNVMDLDLLPYITNEILSPKEIV